MMPGSDKFPPKILRLIGAIAVEHSEADSLLQKEQWKSITTGTDKIIQRDGDRIYVETVLPEYLREVGCSTMSDLKKQGDILSWHNEGKLRLYVLRAGRYGIYSLFHRITDRYYKTRY
jgi:hypothetical protein